MYLAASGGGSGSLVPLLLIAGLFVLTYFLIIRPQSKRKREQAQMQSAIGPGTDIVTIGGMYGTVVEVDDESVTLEIAPGIHARYARAAIGQVRKPVEQSEEADEQGDESGEVTADHAGQAEVDEAQEAPKAVVGEKEAK